MDEHGVVRAVRATAGDAMLVAPLFDAYRVFYQQRSDPAGAERFITERLMRDDSVIFLALVPDPGSRRYDGVGFTQLYPSFTSVGLGRTLILNDLYVDPKYRRAGVGKMLMQAAAAHARETGAKSLSLLTARDNEAAKGLYAAMGWALDEKFDRYLLKL
jgi:ribosomal protein S18 acetylase RimI-like enzyme